MTNDLFSDFNDRSKDFMERASQFNETLFHQLAKAAEIQMEAMRRYTEIASEQSRKLAEARNLEDLKKLSEGQAEAFREISEQVSSDWQAWQDYLFEARAQLKSSINDAQDNSQLSKPAAKTSGKGASSKGDSSA
ncbi:phasin family protein [Marinobacter sp.]|uniref:phasin family protein n=1 Tax=Marinobacter sp. TaxID=50741 RepID=UPI002B4A61A6|nr:phasin family protein [Marinobacter sp.]HKK55273.1 phasin family protein [Marinobacter sp.]